VRHTTINRTKYPRLANRVVVKAIGAEQEYDAMVSEAGRLMEKGEEHLSAEESALLETLAILIQASDKERYPLADLTPNVMLAHLMESSGRKASDLLPVFGTRGRLSEVLNGKRSISQEQAKKLAGFFKVPAEVFI
jgi:HTH-type transcriptional regulator/antitoxin HigA